MWVIPQVYHAKPGLLTINSQFLHATGLHLVYLWKNILAFHLFGIIPSKAKFPVYLVGTLTGIGFSLYSVVPGLGILA